MHTGDVKSPDSDNQEQLIYCFKSLKTLRVSPFIHKRYIRSALQRQVEKTRKTTQFQISISFNISASLHLLKVYGPLRAVHIYHAELRPSEVRRPRWKQVIQLTATHSPHL